MTSFLFFFFVTSEIVFTLNSTKETRQAATMPSLRAKKAETLKNLT